MGKVVDGGLAYSFIRTYSLPPRLQKRILRIVNFSIIEERINSADELYLLIDNLVNRFTEPYTLSLSLDQAVSRESDRTFHEVIGAPDSEEGYSLRWTEIRRMLQDSISPENLGLLSLLLSKREELDLTISLDMIKESAVEINERLTMLRRIYEKEGELFLPSRPIEAVRFTPFQIRFKKRNYHGNPLAYYLEHQKEYEGLGRWGFYQSDSGLCAALRRKNQLEIVMPENNSPHRLSQESIDEIVAVHPFCNQNSGVAHKMLGKYSRATILKYWRAAGLPVRRAGSPSSERARARRRIINPREIFLEYLREKAIIASSASGWKRGFLMRIHDPLEGRVSEE